jgi:hypothetical protein
MMNVNAYCERCTAGCMAIRPGCSIICVTLCWAAENEALDCLGEAFFVV